MSELARREPAPLSGLEEFRRSQRAAGFCVRDFWSWATSDLLSNATRGVLAEFIVARDVGAEGLVRDEWAEYDLRTPAGVRVEVKSSAEIQSWAQARPSKISFDIAPKKPMVGTGDRQRRSDVYVFCVLEGSEPMNLDRWSFLVLATRVLDSGRPAQKTITRTVLLDLGAVQGRYGRIGDAIRSALEPQ